MTLAPRLRRLSCSLHRYALGAALCLALVAAALFVLS
jgi:hypothetical protein